MTGFCAFETFEVPWRIGRVGVWRGGFRLSIAAKDRDIVAAEMTTAQIADAKRMASEWKPK
jgi:hypothetical protein